MVDTEVLGDQFVLGADIVVEGDFGESCGEVRVGRGGGLAVAEERGDYDEVLKVCETEPREGIYF